MLLQSKTWFAHLAEGRFASWSCRRRSSCTHRRRTRRWWCPRHHPSWTATVDAVGSAWEATCWPQHCHLRTVSCLAKADFGPIRARSRPSTLFYYNNTTSGVGSAAREDSSVRTRHKNTGSCGCKWIVSTVVLFIVICQCSLRPHKIFAQLQVANMEISFWYCCPASIFMAHCFSKSFVPNVSRLSSRPS